jgi:hypothetical protein
MSIVAIDLNRSFLIMRLKSIEMYSTGANIIHYTVAIVPYAKFEPPDLDRMIESDPNSKYYSYNT